MTVSNLVMTFEETAMPPAKPARMPMADLLALDRSTNWTPEQEPVFDTDVAHAERLPSIEHAHAPERRSAFEIAFIVLASALGVMVATPPLVQLFLAMRGIQA